MRNKKIRATRKDKKMSSIVGCKVDAKTKAIWNNAKLRYNMSDWLREQLHFHFGNTLTSEQKNQVIREEVGIVNRKYQEYKLNGEVQYSKNIEAIQRKYSGNEVSVIINSGEL